MFGNPHVKPGARPEILPCKGNQAGSHWIHLHLPRRSHKVTLVKNAGTESSLEQVTTDPSGEVLRACATSVSRTERPGNRGLLVRDGNKMDMIGHRTPHENAHTVSRNFFAQHPEMLTAIPLRMKHVHRANTTLRDMVRIAGDYDARQAGY